MFQYNDIITYAELGFFQNMHGLPVNAFRSCHSLTKIDLQYIETYSQYSIYDIRAEQIIFKEGVTTIPNICFGGAFVVKYADLPASITTIGNNNINNFATGAVLVCRATTPPTLGSGNTSASKIYVPAESVAAYKAAARWSGESSKIRQIEGTWYETHRSLEP